MKDTLAALAFLIEYERRHDLINSKIIVFGVTANLVALYAEVFRNQRRYPLQVYELQSRMGQPARTRTTKEFKEATSGIMFATDVIGRGMDFPNVTCVIQVGLPANGEQYVHRVGRTARVDRDGRAVILLTQAETFFLSVNRQLPIEPYNHTGEILRGLPQSKAVMSEVLRTVGEKPKQKAYSSYMGFMKTFMNKLNVKPEGLVAMANELAVQGMDCPEPPPMEKRQLGRWV